jgi:hydrogenase maturation protease
MINRTVLVVGVGTRYRNDDAAGLIVAERLKAQVAGSATVLLHEGEGVSLMERLEAWEAAILIDAVSSGAPAGTVQRFDVKTGSLPAGVFRHSTHAFGAANAIELGRALQRLPQHLIVYGIERRDFAAGTKRSGEVEAAVARAAGRVVEEIRVMQEGKR